MAFDAENSKTNKINFFSGILSELGHSDHIPVYESNFANMPIFQEILNSFLVRFTLNDLQMESFQIYATGQSKMAVSCCY